MPPKKKVALPPKEDTKTTKSQQTTTKPQQQKNSTSAATSKSTQKGKKVKHEDDEEEVATITKPIKGTKSSSSIPTTKAKVNTRGKNNIKEEEKMMSEDSDQDDDDEKEDYNDSDDNKVNDSDDDEDYNQFSKEADLKSLLSLAKKLPNTRQKEIAAKNEAKKAAMNNNDDDDNATSSSPQQPIKQNTTPTNIHELGPETTMNDLMNTQREAKLQNKMIENANIELEFSMDDITTLSNHFGDLFITMTYDHMSDSIIKTLNQVEDGKSKNSARHVLSEYNAKYQRQYFKGFRAGKMDLEASMELDVGQNKKKQDKRMNLDINSTFFSQRSVKDHSKNIDKIVEDIDLVAKHIGNKYENEDEVKKKMIEKKKKKTSGKMWFDLPKTRMTHEAIQTWAILQNKGQLTSTGKFLRVEKSKMPEYSQVGTFVGGGLGDEFITKKEKKRSLAQQFIDDMKETSSVKKRFKAYAQNKQNEYGTGRQYSGVKRKYKK